MKVKVSLIKYIAEIAVVAATCSFALYTYTVNIHKVTSGNDIGVEFKTAIGITKGINPYARISEEDLLVNEDFATLLPSYYYFLLAIAHFSDYSQQDYFNAFRVIIYLAQLISAFALYASFKRKGYGVLGLLAVGFYMLNRWVIDNISDLKQDSISISLLLVSLYFLEKRPKLGFFLYGLSLSVKQIGIFALPILILQFVGKRSDVKPFVKNAVFMLIPTLLPALYYMYADFSGFFYSMMFSLTRAPATNASIAFGYDKILVLFNPTSFGFLTPLFYLFPRLILFLLLSGVYLQVFLGKIKSSFALFAVFFIFAAFNPVVYDQYMVWVMPFVFYAISDYLSSSRQPNVGILTKSASQDRVKDVSHKHNTRKSYGKKHSK